MDPNECYAELLLAIARDDRVEAREYAENLREWIRKGGFAPVGVPLSEVKNNLRNTLDPYADRPNEKYA